LAVEDIVKQVGFDSRSTLFRALRRFHGVTPRECRRAPDGLAFMGGIGTASLTPSLESG
jgi:AraC-like DNA-binding protein